MIRGRKPQVYNTSTKTTDSLLIPAASIDFADQEDLETKTQVIMDSISSLNEKQKASDTVVNSALDIPKQLGVVVYNGELQAPVFDIRSSRIVISGDTVGKDVGTYTAVATILNGSWKTAGEEPLAAEQPVTWTIVPKRIPKPSVNGIYIADGTLQEVKLCDFNPKYCEVKGTVRARDAETYNITVSIINDNVVWDDDNDRNGTVPLSWTIKANNGSTSSDVTDLIVTLTADVNTLKSTVKTLQTETSGSSNTCNCATVTASLKRRIELLEFFGSSDDFDMAALIALLTRQVTDLENTADALEYNDLDAEIKGLLSAINKALAKAAVQADIDTLNSLKTRIMNLYSLHITGTDLREFRDSIDKKKKEIKDLLDNDDIDKAKEKLNKLRQELKDLTDNMDDDTKEKNKLILDDIRDRLNETEKEITRKELQKTLDIIDSNCKDIKDKIDNNQDPTDLINSTKALIADSKTDIGDDFPFEKDRVLAAEDRLNDLEKEYNVKTRLAALTADLDDIISKTDVYSNAVLNEKITACKQELEQIKTLAQQLNPNPFVDDIAAAETKLTAADNLIWKKIKEQELAVVKNDLETINTAVLAADPAVDDMTQWNTALTALETTVNGVSTESATRDTVPDNLAAVQGLLETVKNNIRNASINKTIAGLNAELDNIRDQMAEGTVIYDEVKIQLDDIETRVEALENDNNSDDVKDALTLLNAKIVSTRQLNEDMRIYLIVKPMLTAIKQKIYDEDLDILWAELAAAESKLEGAGTSSRINELKNDITEIKNILNSFSKNNTVENVLEHVRNALNIAITSEDFDLSGTDYDGVKQDLEKLERAVITVTDEELVSFPSWYSLSDEDKAYLLENNLRKIRRNMLTTEDLQNA